MSVKVQINGEWKEIKADAGDEVTYDQAVEAAGLPTDRVYRIEYTGAVGLGGDLRLTSHFSSKGSYYDQPTSNFIRH